ncbi:MAG: BlaI/MecI/CopY family transcriptional regulator [Lachnospiraceae bacterium]|nr:BlaI/MecI/CopY family transcriptional regulator [Lachnospiraceae bacterium]
MNELPNSELEIMMIIWSYRDTVTRSEVEEKLIKKGRRLDETSILTYLSRLQKRGFLKVEKKGKKNFYTPLITEEEYMQKESKRILKQMFHSSLKNFVCALYDGKEVDEKDKEELLRYIDYKRKKE